MKGKKCLIIKSLCLVLLSLVCSLSFITSDSYATNKSTYYAKSVSSARYTETMTWSVSGTFVPGPTYDYQATLEAKKDSSFTDLCFVFDGLRTDSEAVMYNMSFSTYAQSPFLWSPLGGHAGGDRIRNVVTSDDFNSYSSIDSFLLTLPGNTNPSNPGDSYLNGVLNDTYSYATHNVTGIISNDSNAPTDRLCFSGFWAYNRGNWTNLQISQPVITTYAMSDADLLGAIKSGNSQAHSDAQANLNAVNNQTKQQHADAEAQKKATEEQTKQQQEQYEKDKQEESERENQGSEDMNEATGIFNFNILNPFAGLWDLFNPSQCTSIPIISQWVHSESAQYCSWFPNSVRSVLTPVFGIASIMLLFGFFVRWLSGSRGDRTIDIGWDSDFYSNGGTGL